MLSGFSVITWNARTQGGCSHRILGKLSGAAGAAERTLPSLLCCPASVLYLGNKGIKEAKNKKAALGQHARNWQSLTTNEGLGKTFFFKWTGTMIQTRPIKTAMYLCYTELGGLAGSIWRVTTMHMMTFTGFLVLWTTCSNLEHLPVVWSWTHAHMHVHAQTTLDKTNS